MIFNLVRLNKNIYLIEKEDTKTGKIIERNIGEYPEVFEKRVQKIYNEVVNSYKELKGKELT